MEFAILAIVGVLLGIGCCVVDDDEKREKHRERERDQLAKSSRTPPSKRGGNPERVVSFKSKQTP